MGRFLGFRAAKGKAAGPGSSDFQSRRVRCSTDQRRNREAGRVHAGAESLSSGAWGVNVGCWHSELPLAVIFEGFSGCVNSPAVPIHESRRAVGTQSVVEASGLWFFPDYLPWIGRQPEEGNVNPAKIKRCRPWCSSGNNRSYRKMKGSYANATSFQRG